MPNSQLHDEHVEARRKAGFTVEHFWKMVVVSFVISLITHGIIELIAAVFL